MKTALISLLKQPLLHFVAGAVLIFVVDDFLAEPVNETAGYSERQIVVDKTALLNFLQYRAKAFDPETFNAQFIDAMPSEEVAAIVDDYVREEALYREALAMGMEQGDYIIRQRLVQKVEFLLENLVADTTEPSEAELAAFFQERQDDYHVDEVYTFTHIFFDAQQGGMEEAARRATEVLENSAAIAFDESVNYGDRYPFLQNYVERTRDFVSNNFNDSFVAALDQLDPARQQWAGPFASRYGQHLVLLRARTEARVPALDEIRARVLDDFRYEAQIRKRQEAEAKVLAEYDVIVELQ